MEHKNILLVAVDMGYGHQRTAYPLRKIAYHGKVINANNYPGIPPSDRKIWQATRRFYEFISDFKKIPLLGEALFDFFDKFQRIPGFYPKRDLSKTNFSLKRIYNAIKIGWGRDLIEKLNEISKSQGGNMPLVSTFFSPAFMAEEFGYDGPIFLIVCDADVSRAWVALNPAKSRIKYLAPNTWVRNRLKLYGVKEENIFLSGFPLPSEIIGDEMEIIKSDVKKRVLNLDPNGEFRKNYDFLVERYLGQTPKSFSRPLTILFSIGGAGAQKELVLKFLKNLSKAISASRVKPIISCGKRENVKKYFEKHVKSLGIEHNVEYIFEPDISNYFDKFNQKLREADILWTKPSELSFYTGLGIPMIIAPTVGSQEEFNRRWLLWIGSGILEENPNYANQWLFDYWESGRLAEVAMEGFIEVEKNGFYNIKKICLG